MYSVLKYQAKQQRSWFSISTTLKKAYEANVMPTLQDRIGTSRAKVLRFFLMSILRVELYCIVAHMLDEIFTKIDVHMVHCLSIVFPHRLPHYNLKQLFEGAKILLFVIISTPPMARIQVNIQFLYEGVIYADTLGFIPRHQAIKIPELRVQENEAKAVKVKKAVVPSKQVSKPGKVKKDQKEQQEIDEEMIDENQEMEMDLEDPDIQNEGEEEGEVDDLDEEEQPDIEEMQNQENQSDNQNQGEEDEEEIDESNEGDDLSEISRSFSPQGGYGKYKTKRQKGQLDNFLELPLKKPRKDAKKFDEATQLIKKEQKERKRRQYIKKLMQAQEKATFDKILNETGRKFRQREQKQLKEVKEKDGKAYRTLGNVPKIITKQNQKGVVLYLNKTELFQPQVLHEPNIQMSEPCSICRQNIGKYKTKSGERFCSVSCFKRIQKTLQQSKMCA